VNLPFLWKIVENSATMVLSLPRPMQTIRKPVVRVYAIDIDEARSYLAGVRDMATEAAVSPDPPVITLALRVLELAPRTIRRMRRRVRTRRLARPLSRRGTAGGRSGRETHAPHAPHAPPGRATLASCPSFPDGGAETPSPFPRVWAGAQEQEEPGAQEAHLHDASDFSLPGSMHFSGKWTPGLLSSRRERLQKMLSRSIDPRDEPCNGLDGLSTVLLVPVCLINPDPKGAGPPKRVE
jgi:hypothetical protein